MLTYSFLILNDEICMLTLSFQKKALKKL